MQNPHAATYLYVAAETERGNALAIDTGHGREFVPTSAVLMWKYNGRLVIACPDWVMEQKPAFSKCERLDREQSYDFMVGNAELLPHWIYPSVTMGRRAGMKI
jgi:hypothetical protein